MIHRLTRSQMDTLLKNRGLDSKPPKKDGEEMYIYQQYGADGHKCMKIVRIKKDTYDLTYSNDLPPPVKKEIKKEIKKRSAQFRKHLDKQTEGYAKLIRADGKKELKRKLQTKKGKRK